MIDSINVYGKKPRVNKKSEIIDYKDMSFFLYNDKDVTMGNCELYSNEAPYVLVSTFENNMEAKQFIEQHYEDIAKSIESISQLEVEFVSRAKALKKRRKEINNV